MAQYIDKDALIVEIEKILDKLYNLLPDASKVEKGMITISEACSTGKYTALESFKDYLNTLEVKEVDLKQKSFVKIDRKLLFEICDGILNHYGYSDVNDCPENDSECFWGKWDEGFRKKVENIRKNS